MTRKLKACTLLLMIVMMIISCNHRSPAKETKKAVDPAPDTTPPPPVTLNETDNLASFISGMPYIDNRCYHKIDSVIKWKKYANELDTLFSSGNKRRFSSMTQWADTELIRNQDITTLFYPFGGPDFLNAHIFYPGVDRYIMIGLEPVGYIPDVCKEIPDSVASYFNAVTNSMNDIFRRSYFITSRMNTDLNKAKANGTVPLISLFIKRTGHHILSIQRLGIDTLGNCLPIDSIKNQKNVISGVKIDFTAQKDQKVQSVYYFRTDISDAGLKKRRGFKTYLSKLPVSFTYLKAASYLMHFDDFKMIRDLVFEKSRTILQDDSGIAFKYFDVNKWDIKLYGKYSKPIKDFSYISEPDLEKAYKTFPVKALDFTVGYSYKSGSANLLYAIKK